MAGNLTGLKTLFIYSDINGNNTLLHGLTVFGNAVPTSIIENPALITNTSYVSEVSSAQTYAFLAMSSVYDGLLYSVDGLNWTNIQNASLVNILNLGTDFIQNIYSNGSMWIGIASITLKVGLDQSPIIYSTDGLNWYLADISACTILRQKLIEITWVRINSAKWINTKWIATFYYDVSGYDGFTSANTVILQSVDGIHWTEISTINNFIVADYPIQFIDNKLYLWSQETYIKIAYSSDNGTTWSVSQPNSSYIGPIALGASNTTLIICASDSDSGANTLLYSTDFGITLNPVTQITNLQTGVTSQELGYTATRILFVNNMFIASVQAYNYISGEYNHGSVMTSPDGITWTFRGPRNGYAQTPIKWNEQTGADAKFYMKITLPEDNTQSCITSNDGISWTTNTIPLTFDDIYLRSALERAINNDSMGWNRFGDQNSQTADPRGGLSITVSKPLINNQVLYIKNGKTIVDAAVLNYNLYITNLLAAGFTPVTTLGKLTSSFMTRSALPDTITDGTPFTLGTTTLTPTSKGLYSPTTSYTTADLVEDSYGSVYMCTVGPDSRGIVPTSLGNAPVESPGSSVFWHTVTNNGWDSLVYDVTTDLVMTPVAFGTGTVIWTSADFPPNNIVQLPSTFLNGYTLFGTGVFQRNTITQLSYAYEDATLCYVFTQGETRKDLTKTFYVKNGKSALETMTVSTAFNTISGILVSASSYLNTILSSTTSEGANTTNSSLATLQSTVMSLETIYTNTILQSCVSLARTLLDESVKAGQSAANLLNFYFLAIAEGVPSEIADLQTSKDTAESYMATIVTKLTTISDS